MNNYLDAGHHIRFGTFPLRGNDLTSAIPLVSDIGYRRFDTAQKYQNEREVGDCLRTLGPPHDELLITTKVSPRNFAAADFLPSVEQSLRDLQTDRIDMLLLHQPDQHGQNGAAVNQQQKAHDLGYATHIRISYCTTSIMEDAKRRLYSRPGVNQVEFHPFLDRRKLLVPASRLVLPLNSYCAFALGKMATSPLLGDIGATHGKTGTQAALRWTLQRGMAINAMSTKADNLQRNFDLLDFQLNNDEMARILTLMAEGYRILN